MPEKVILCCIAYWDCHIHLALVSLSPDYPAWQNEI